MRYISTSVIAAAFAFTACAAIQAAPVAAADDPIGPFMVFFAAKSAALTPQAAAILDNAIDAIKARPGEKITLAGHTDDTMSEADALKLSQTMALNARAYLVAHGIPAASIAIEAHGAADPLIFVAKGVAEPQNRRVEIVIGEKSGW